MDTKTRQQKIFERLHKKINQVETFRRNVSTCKDLTKDFGKQSYWQEYKLMNDMPDFEMRFNFSL